MREFKVIGYLKGIVLEKQLPQILLEVHGIGYEIYMPVNSFYSLPDIGKEVAIFTHFVIHKENQLIFGFIHKQELILFRELIKINGVGPKLALKILSSISVRKFVKTIQNQEINILAKLPGIGRKIAKRLIVEMKDRLEITFKNICISQQNVNNINSIPITIDSNPKHEAIAALIALGYKSQEAISMVNKVANSEVNCEVLIRNALRAVV